MIKKNQSFLQKVGAILNTSSETFMLVALIGLFVMPFVIAKNLDPIVKTAEESTRNLQAPVARNVNTVEDSSVAQLPVDEFSETTNRSSVLGVETSVDPLTIEEDAVNLKFFDVAQSKTEEKQYELTLATEQIFGKIPVLKLTNGAQSAKMYEFSVVSETKLGERSLFIDNVEYTLNELPQNLTLEPGQSVDVSLMSNKVRSTEVTLKIQLVENQ